MADKLITTTQFLRFTMNKFLPNGVYIMASDRALYPPEIWDEYCGNAQCVVLVTDNCAFGIALDEVKGYPWRMSSNSVAETGIPLTGSMGQARQDFNGFAHTILLINKLTGDRMFPAANYCFNYSTPAGITGGYLGSAGEWYEIHQHLEEINSALKLVGGTEIKVNDGESTKHMLTSNQGGNTIVCTYNVGFGLIMSISKTSGTTYTRPLILI